MADRIIHTWNGGSPEAATAAADRRAEQARQKLRDAYVRTGASRHPIGCTEPFMHADAPGWVYLPVENVVVLAETARRMKDLFA